MNPSQLVLPPTGVGPLPPSPTQASLETLLLRATDPRNRNLDANLVKQFCTVVNSSTEGPQLAARLLGHRIQSPQVCI